MSRRTAQRAERARRAVVTGLAVLASGALPGAVAPVFGQEAAAGPERPSFLEVAWPGAALGAAGFLVGGLAGGNLVDCGFDDDGFCELQAAFFGAAALGTIGLATGVHLGNDRRGNYAVDLGVAAGIWAVSIGLIAASGFDDGVTTVGFIALPVVQLLGTVATERSMGDRRAREREARSRSDEELELGVGPAPGGGIAIAGSLRL